MDRATSIAEQRQCTVSDLIRDLIGQLTITTPTEDSLLGMMADESDLMDQVSEAAMQARSDQPLR